MLPQAYQLPAAIVLLISGLVSCFLGYRLFRAVLAIFGFIIGALAASSMAGASETTWMIVAALAGGILGAVILLFAYFVGVALVGAGLGALVANLLWSQFAGDPHPIVVIVFSVAGALGAMVLQRYVIIVGTAFGGAWTMIVGATAITADRAARAAASSGDAWVVYPMDPAPGRGWVPIVWLALGLIGTTVQLALTAPKQAKGRKS